MAGVERGKGEPLEVGAGTLEFLTVLPEVQAADDVHDPFLPAASTGMFYCVADPSVRAARHHHDPLAAPVGEGGVVQQPIGLGAAPGHYDLSRPRVDRLEQKTSPDLAKKYQVRSEEERTDAELNRQYSSYRCLIEQGADVCEGRFGPALQAERVTHQAGETVHCALHARLDKEAEEVVQTSRVVVVPVGEDDGVEVEQVDAQPLGIPNDEVRVPRVEQELPPLRLDEDGKAVLGVEGTVVQRRIVNDDRCLHGRAVKTGHRERR